jgi:hypothetical protein
MHAFTLTAQDDTGFIPAIRDTDGNVYSHSEQVFPSEDAAAAYAQAIVDMINVQTQSTLDLTSFSEV